MLILVEQIPEEVTIVVKSLYLKACVADTTITMVVAVPHKQVLAALKVTIVLVIT